MDWSGCELVEVVPGKRSGDPLIRGTRIPANAIVSNFKAGSPLKEIAENYPSAAEDTIRGVLTYAIERSSWDAKTLVDWKGCALVEQVPGRCSGAPTVVGTRIFPDTVAKYYWSGATVDEIAEDFPSLSKDTIRELIRYVKSKESQAA
jgi:uncharacterized protein (DUF433 family)